jgi:hypothetical protein
MADSLGEKKAKRFKYLNRLYEKTNGDTFVHVHMFEDIGNELGFSTDDTESVVQYLVDERLMEYAAMGGSVAITHYGVTQVEAALSEPEKPTKYFDSIINIVHVGQMTHSHIQQVGSGSNVLNTGLSADELAPFKQFVDELKAHLPKITAEARWEEAELRAQLATLEAQISARRPNKFILRETLSSFRTIFEGMAGNILAAELLMKLQPWIDALSR